MKALIFGLGVALLSAASAIADGIEREEIRRVPVPGSDTMEVVVMRLTVPVGDTIPLHSHNGDEHAVVITPTTAEAPNGNIVKFDVGTSLYFPDGEIHGGLTNVGDAPMEAITTFVVRVGEPLTVLAN